VTTAAVRTIGEKMTKTPRETQSGKNEWTWQEISEHNSRDSCWFYVDRNVYNVTEWLQNILVEKS